MASLLVFTYLGLVFTSAVAFAWPPEFGPEFTFTNQKIINATTAPNHFRTHANTAAVAAWKTKMESLCKSRGDCIVVDATDKHLESCMVKYNDGFWYMVGVDSDVVEVTAKKSTLDEIKKNKERMQQDIFDMAKSMDLEPHYRKGSGHLNIGLESTFGPSSVGDGAELFRNFEVATANHPELAQGVLGVPHPNSPTLTMHGPNAIADFSRVLQNFDENPTNYFDLASAIEDEVYARYPGPKPYDNGKYYQNHRLNAVSPIALAKERRIEVRGITPQKSIDDYVTLCEFYQEWLDYLREIKGPIPVDIPLQQEMSPSEMKARWHQLVGRILRHKGLPPTHFDALLRPEIANAPTIYLPGNYDEIAENPKLYAPLARAAKKMSDKEKIRFNEGSYGRSNEQRYLNYDPKIMSKEDHDLIVAGTRQRAQALKALFEDIQSGKNAVLESGVIHPTIIKQILARSGINQDSIKKVPWETSGFYYAPDIVRHSDGEYYVLEDNVGNDVGGLADAADSRQDFLHLRPEFRKQLRDSDADSPVKKIVESLRSMAKSPEEALVVGVNRNDLKLYRRLVEQLMKEGVHVMLHQGSIRGDPTYLDTWVDGDLYLFEHKGIHASKTKVGAVAFIGLTEPDVELSFPNVRNAWEAGRLPTIGMPTAWDRVLGDKELSKHVDSLIGYYLHEKPILPSSPGKSFRAINEKGSSVFNEDLFGKVFAHLKDYVIKEAQGRAGQNVFIGQNLSQHRINELKEAIRANPENFIADDKLDVSTIDDAISDTRSYAVVTKDRTHVSELFWGRSASAKGTQYLNVTKGAHVIPVFTEGRDTPPFGGTFPLEERQETSSVADTASPSLCFGKSPAGFIPKLKTFLFPKAANL